MEEDRNNAAPPPREELIERIREALETAPYINLLMACRDIEYAV